MAHDEGLDIMIHVSGADAIKSTCEMIGKIGARATLEHGFWADESSCRSMKDAGIIWTPTCVTVKNNLDGGRYPSAVMNAILENHNKNLRYAASIGVDIACGSDSGAYNVFHGAGAVQEYEHLVSLGINPAVL